MSFCETSLINREAVYEKRNLLTKPDYASITCSTISNIPYNLIFTTQFNDSSILIYSYLMGVHAIDQHIFPKVLGKKKGYIARGQRPRAIEHFGLSIYLYSHKANV
jgi:hypothetical protein